MNIRESVLFRYDPTAFRIAPLHDFWSGRMMEKFLSFWERFRWRLYGILASWYFLYKKSLSLLNEHLWLCISASESNEMAQQIGNW